MTTFILTIKPNWLHSAKSSSLLYFFGKLCSCTTLEMGCVWLNSNCVAVHAMVKEIEEKKSRGLIFLFFGSLYFLVISLSYEIQFKF